MVKRKVEDEPEPKPLVFLHGEIKTPPFSDDARKEAGYLLWQLQIGESLGMPRAEPLPTIGRRCGALRIRDEQHNWRIMYRADATAILVIEIYDKKTRKIPAVVSERCKKRLQRYDELQKGEK